jgi:hypothetical protein
MATQEPYLLKRGGNQSRDRGNRAPRQMFTDFHKLPKEGRAVSASIAFPGTRVQHADFTEAMSPYRPYSVGWLLRLRLGEMDTRSRLRPVRQSCA